MSGTYYDPRLHRGQLRGVRLPVTLWWLTLPSEPTHQEFSLHERLFGPMYSHIGDRLGLFSRLLYGWVITDDPYFDRVDQELKWKGL